MFISSAASWINRYALSTVLVSWVKQAQEETAFLRFFATDLDPHDEILLAKSLVGLDVIAHLPNRMLAPTV